MTSIRNEGFLNQRKKTTNKAKVTVLSVQGFLMGKRVLILIPLINTHFVINNKSFATRKIFDQSL